MKIVSSKRKRRLFSLLMAITMAFSGFATGCQPRPVDAPTQTEVESTVAAAETEAPQVKTPALKVYASIYPIYYFAQRIGGDRLALALVIPPGTDAHDFEPKAKLVGDMTTADLILYNGLGLEHWSENLFTQLPDSVAKIETSKGIETHTIEEAVSGEVHEHEHADEAKDEEGHDHTGLDPHIWLDPTKALQQATNIYEALKAADAEGAALYSENFEQLKKDIEALDATFQAELANFKRREIVVGHAAFGYLAERYNLKQIAISGISPLEEPSAAQLGELTHLVEDHKVTTIFYETLASTKFSEVLAAETGTKTAVLNPLEGLTQEDIDSGQDFLSIMLKNLEAIKAALKD